MIQASGLSKRYGATMAVDDLSFTVPPGQVTGFLGPNGAGKSTTMRLILGLDAPTSGQVTVGGRRYAAFRRPLFQVGAMLEVSGSKAFHGGRSARNHLLCLALSNGIGPGRVDQVLDLVGLASAARRHAGGFSLGMGQRLGIAAALLGDPPVLMLDEPVNGLDPEGVVWIRTLLKSLAAEGRTVLLSSHLMSEMALTADRLIIIGRGRLITQTTMADFLGGAGGSVRARSPQAALPAGDAMRTSLSDPGVLRAVTGAGQYLTVLGLLGLGLGAVIRSSAGAIATLLGVLFVPSLLMALMPQSWQDTIGPYLPMNAGETIYAVHHQAHTLGTWPGFAVFCLYAAAALAAGFILINHRDA